MYDPTKNLEGSRKIGINRELNKLTYNENIVNFINSNLRMLFGHLNRMKYDRVVNKIY